MFLVGIGAALCAAQPALAAPSILRGAGNIRSLSLVNNRTAESLDAVFWADGEYVPEALTAFNHILRDWREDLATKMDPHVLDIMSKTHDLLDCGEAFEIVSGYRSEKTNAMLRRRNRGVAKKSYHTQGKAVDLKLTSRSVSQIAAAAKSLSAGGVGKYRRSSFTHVDSGPVRTWGR